MPLKSFENGLALGLVVGSVIMGLAVRKQVHDIIKLDEKQAERRMATLMYVVDKTSPYVPNSVLLEIQDYLQLNLMVSEEEGRDFREKY